MQVNISMLDGAYFLGRKQILDWINELLKLEVAKYVVFSSFCSSLYHIHIYTHMYNL